MLTIILLSVSVTMLTARARAAKPLPVAKNRRKAFRILTAKPLTKIGTDKKRPTQSLIDKKVERVKSTNECLDFLKATEQIVKAGIQQLKTSGRSKKEVAKDLDIALRVSSRARAHVAEDLNHITPVTGAPLAARALALEKEKLAFKNTLSGAKRGLEALRQLNRRQMPISSVKKPKRPKKTHPSKNNSDLSPVPPKKHTLED